MTRKRSTTHIRVSTTTYQRLSLLADRWHKAADRGYMVQWWNGDQGPTYEEMIRYLVDHLVGHRQRSREAAARRKGRGKDFPRLMDWEL